MRKKYSVLFLLFFLSAWTPSAGAYALGEPYDYSKWDQCLKQYVDRDGNMNYSALKKNPQLLDGYIEQISKVNFEELTSDWPREEQMAFWLNAYHAYLTKLIIDHYPIRSVQDIPGVWDIKGLHVGKSAVSLNDIRLDLLLSPFQDEKIITSLACSAVSCPPLMTEAYTGQRVEGMLFLNARQFVNDTRNNKIIPEENKVYLAKIFKWHAGHFVLDFGDITNDTDFKGEEYSVLSFIRYYLADAEKINFLETGGYKVKYLAFDWSLRDSKS